MRKPIKLITFITVIILTSCGKTTENKVVEGNWRFDDFRLGYSELHISNNTIEWYTEKSLRSVILFYKVTGDSLKTYDSPKTDEANILDRCRFEIVNDSTMNFIYFSKKKGERTISLKRLFEEIKTKQMFLKEGISENETDNTIKDLFVKRMKLYTGRELQERADSLRPINHIQK